MGLQLNNLKKSNTPAMMNLAKSAPGEKPKTLNLTKAAPDLLKALVLGVSWDGDFDLDAIAVVLTDGKVLDNNPHNGLVAFPMFEKDYNHAPTGEMLWEVPGMTHSGDATDGNADGWDETIGVELGGIQGDEILLFVASFAGDGSPVTFGATENPKAVLMDQSGKPMIDIDLAEDVAFGTSFQMARIFKNEEGEWLIENASEQLGSDAVGIKHILTKYNLG